MSDQIKSALVRIFNGKAERAIGVGFLVSEEYIFTCAHVVAQALSIPDETLTKPDANLHLEFPFIVRGHMLIAHVVYWQPVSLDPFSPRHDTEDIAILKLARNPHLPFRPVKLLTSGTLWGHNFRAFGFPLGYDEGVWASGILKDQRVDGRVQIEDVKIPGHSVEPGFSGTPVWDDHLEGVVGMVVEADRQVSLKAAYIIPATALVRAWSEFSQQISSTSKQDRLPTIVINHQHEDASSSFPLFDFAHHYPLQEHFTGRIRERKMLTEWLTTDNSPLLALIAFGGMGKSSLTWFWVKHDVFRLPLSDSIQRITESVNCLVDESSRPEGGLWWSFYEQDSHFTAFLDEALNYASGTKVNPATLTSTHEKVRALLTVLQQRRLLIILDGFERELRAYANLSAAYQGDSIVEDVQRSFRACTNPHVADFLRGVAALPLKSRVLLTSRLFPRELEDLAGCRKVELLPLDSEDAIAFFQAQGINGSRVEIQRLCAIYGYHPLTLRLLAGLIRDDPAHPGDPTVANEYNPLAHLIARKHHILALAYDTLSISLRELLSRLAALRSSMTFQTVQIISPFSSDAELKEGLRNLIMRGLLQIDRERERYDLHPIVRQYAYDRLFDKQKIHSSLRDYFDSIPKPQRVQNLEDLTPVIELYHHTVGSGQYDEAWMLYNERIRNPLYYHLCEYELDIQLLDAIPRTLSGIPKLSRSYYLPWVLLYATMSYERLGRAREGIKYAEQAIQMARRFQDSYNIGSSLTHYSMSACDLGQLRQASLYIDKAVLLFEQLGNTHWIGTSHRSYGRVLMYCGDSARALQEFDLAKKAYDLSSESSHGHCVLLIFHAELSLLNDNYIQAYQIAQNAREQSCKESFKAEEIKALWLLGAAYVVCASKENSQQIDFLAEAYNYLIRALTDCRRIHLLDAEADILLTLACWYNTAGQKEQAWKYVTEALAIAIPAKYRLKLANIYNLMAQMALDVQNQREAYQYAQLAYNYAWCDGAPYCYQPALNKATQLLLQIHLPQ